MTRVRTGDLHRSGTAPVAAPLHRIEAWVRSECPTWLPADAQRPLRVSALWGHRPGRATLLVSHRGRRAPRIVVKLASRDIDPGHLLREHHALRTAAQDLPPDVTDTMPQSLGLYEDDDMVAFAMTAVEGRRSTVPALTSSRPSRRDRHRLERHVAEVRAWSARLREVSPSREMVALADSRIGDSLRIRPEPDTVAPAGRHRLRDILESRDLGTLRWEPVWQHGDVAVGNVLRFRGGVHLVDWETARHDHMPWRDDAHLLLSFARDAQRSLGSDRIATAMPRMLAPTTWGGQLLAGLYRERWPHPVPLGTALLLTALDCARPDVLGPDVARHWAQLAVDLTSDEVLRRSCPWLVPS